MHFTHRPNGPSLLAFPPLILRRAVGSAGPFAVWGLPEGPGCGPPRQGRGGQTRKSRHAKLIIYI